MEVFRSPSNPLIEPKDVKPSREGFEVFGVFNAGVAKVGQEVVLLLRVAERPISNDPGVVAVAWYDVETGEVVTKEFSKSDHQVDFSDPRLVITPKQTYLTSLSHLRVARSEDGENFEVEDAPVLFPANSYEIFGIEDPRITCIDGLYYVDYVAVGTCGVTTCLASTKDFVSFERAGVIFCPENKDVVIFPEKIGGKYYALHRPVSPLFNTHDVWLAESPDLISWGNHRVLMSPRPGRWDAIKIGAGAVPVRTEAGWLEIYHGVGENNRYCLGAVLLDADRPDRILGVSEQPLVEPEADYECRGVFGNVVFSCGLLCEQERLRIYYGAADTSVAMAEVRVEDVLDSLQMCGQ